MAKTTCTAKFSWEIDKEEIALLGGAVTPDGRLLGEVILGFVSDVVRNTNAQIPFVLSVALPSSQDLLSGKGRPVQVLTQRK